jgi:hypothetical protein
VAATLKKNPPSFPAAQPEATRLLLNFLHGLQQGMDAESILEALASGEDIQAPEVKKRGRKPSSTLREIDVVAADKM